MSKIKRLSEILDVPNFNAMPSVDGDSLSNTFVNVSNIVNDLFTGGASNVASAETVKTLETSKINASAIVNDLTTGGASNVASAETVKVLQDTKVAKAGDTMTGSLSTTGSLSAQVSGTSSLTLGSSAGYNGLHQVDGVAYTIGQNSNSRALRIGSGSGFLSTGVNLAPGGTSWGTFSDERLKVNITEIENCVEKLSGVRCVTYRLKGRDNNNAKKRIGIIAQDIEGKFDEALAYMPLNDKKREKYLSVQYADLVPVLIKAVQELNIELEKVKIELSTLKGE
jgi:hypothetical protein